MKNSDKNVFRIRWIFFHMFITFKRWGLKTSLIPPLFIEMSVSIQKSQQSCICVLGVSILLLSTIFLLELGYGHIVQCGIFFIFFSFYCSNKTGISPISNIIIKYSMFLLLLRAFQLAAISQHFIICCNFNVSVEKKISENYP